MNEKDDASPGLNIDELTASLDFKGLFEEEVDRKQVNFWVDRDYQSRYLALQKRTRYKFGKEICRLIERCVDLAEAADPHRPDKSA